MLKIVIKEHISTTRYIVFSNTNFCDYWINFRWTPGVLEYETNYVFKNGIYL